MKFFVERLTAAPTEFRLEADPSWWRETTRRSDDVESLAPEPIELRLRVSDRLEHFAVQELATQRLMPPLDLAGRRR